MKKILLLFVAITAATIATSQIDSAQTMDVIHTSFQIAQTIHPGNWIPGVDNNVLVGLISTIATVVLAYLHRRKTVKKWKRNGDLSRNIK